MPHKGLHMISQDLVIATEPGTWTPSRNFTAADITEMRREAAIELKDSPVGQQLYARGGDEIFSKALEVFAERVQPPSVAPFYETLMEAAKDVLLMLPAVQAESQPVLMESPSEEETERVQAAHDDARDQRAKDLNRFAHMINAALAYGGPKCLKPSNGYVTLKFEEKGTPYTYQIKYGNGSGERDPNGNLITSDEYNKFMRDFEEATSRGLIA